jgi:transposase
MLSNGEPASPETRFVDSPYIYDVAIPKDDPLRETKKRIDFSFARDIAREADVYSADRGRKCLDPAVFAAVSFLQYLDNVTDREAELKAATDLRWKFFLGLQVDSPSPVDHSTLSKTRKLWGASNVAAMMQGITKQAVDQGLVDNDTHLIDSCASIANAALMNAVKFVRTVWFKLHKALRPVLTVEQDTQFSAREKALREDTSWFLSDQLKEAHLKAWGLACAELIAFTEGLVDSPGTLGELREWPRHEARIRRQLEIAQRYLADQEPKNTSAKKDKMSSPTDPDARRADRTKGKVKHGFLGSIEMDKESEIIVAVSGEALNAEDGPQLPGLIEQVQAQGQKPKTVSADSAYADGGNRALLERSGIKAHIHAPKHKASKKGLHVAADFAYDHEAGAVTCPAGQISTNGKPKKGGGWNYNFPKAVCIACPLRDKCISNEAHGRTAYIGPHRHLHDKARVAQKTPEHKAAMKARLAVEHKVGELLNAHGLRRCRYRGLEMYRIQLYLIVMTVNIKRIVKLAIKKDAKAALIAAAQAA